MSGEQETAGAREFATTQWSVVMEAARLDEPGQADALAKLCETYWHPLYFFIRRKGHDPHEAKDLIQGFFCRLVEKNFIQAVDPEKGRFRAFLITALKFYMANEWDRKNAIKRGGSVDHISLDFELADRLYLKDQQSSMDAENLYDKAWALTVLNKVLGELRKDYDRRGKGPLFDFLRASVLGQSEEMSYEEAAKAFNVALGTIKSEAFRMRKRFRNRLRETIADTVESESEIDHEVRYLIARVA